MKFMTKTTKLLIGAATVWPPIYMLVFMAFMLLTMLSTFATPRTGGAPLGFPVAFAGIFVLHLFTMLEIIGLLVFYIVNVFRNPNVVGDRKALWAIVLFLGGFIAMPIYWYLYIWRDMKPTTLPANGGVLEPPSQAWTSEGEDQNSVRPYVPPSGPPDWR